MATLTGTDVGVYWGSISGTMTHSGAAWLVTTTSEGITLEANVTELKNRFGEVFGLVINDEKKKLSLTVFPSNASTAVPPMIGETMTILSNDTDVNGGWIVSSSSKAYKSEGVLEFSVEVWRPNTMVTNGTINAED